MAASNGLSDASSDLTGLTHAVARALGTVKLGRRGLYFAVQALTAALMAVCGAPAHAQTQAVGDRYSGEIYTPPYRQSPYRPSPYRPAPGASGPTLSWPGKTIAADPARVAPVAAASPPPAGQPQSIYDPPAEARGAATGGETARFYSLHRPYGLTPDPDPIAPAAYTQTADLSVPPGASPADRAVSSTAVPPRAVQADASPSPPSQP
jgi:hypothetical protein